MEMAACRRHTVCVHQVVYDVGGIVDKHLGDGLMAVFGLTGQGGGPSGVQAMRRIVDGYPDLVAKLHPSDARGLRLSLGLAHGEVVMGMVGGESRKELAIIGQPANLASRLQEFSKVAIDPTQEDANPLGVFNHAMGICAPPLGDELKGIESVDLEGRIKVRDFSEIIRLNVIRS